MTKKEIRKMKVNTLVPLPLVIPEEKNWEKVTSEGQEKAHTSIIIGPESTM